MRYEAADWLRMIRELEPEPSVLMEVCGTHTMEIAKAGIKGLLPEGVELLSGPGCPVCVTPPEKLDQILALSMEKDVLITSYGDMLRVPGSVPGDHLLRRRMLGAKVQLVYSPMDAVALAEDRPETQVVFLGAGFETTAPGTAATVLAAKAKGLKNFSVWSLLKCVEPALRALIAQPDFRVQGFLCPGHVAAVIGAEAFRFLPEEYGIPAVVGGFEPGEILSALFFLLKQRKEHSPALQNAYPRAVSAAGNPKAKALMTQCFLPRDELWRGLGLIPESGLGFAEELKEFDAERRFGVVELPAPRPTACRCGDVICGRLRPQDCPLFGTRCTPSDPVGPCMVSSEGACAAAQKYQLL